MTELAPRPGRRLCRCHLTLAISGRRAAALAHGLAVHAPVRCIALLGGMLEHRVEPLNLLL